MKIEFNPEKRRRTLADRGLDMAHAFRVFETVHTTAEDDRVIYDETRFITVGYLNNRMVVVVWSLRAGARRIISLRKANEREQEKFGKRLARS
ncbi:MAG: BrnT family toxin [Alphaproteobacteria bacterium]|nr:BrnT family toxin [Alphaproteobacteria bacterium]